MPPSSYHRPTYAAIDLGRLRKNFLWLQSLGMTFVCPMVKANGYGHGAIPIARTLQAAGCHWVGVATVDEGVELREAGISCNILVFDFFGEAAARVLLAKKLTAVVSDQQQLAIIAKLARETVAIHLKFNTGMNRLGFPVEQAPRLLAFLANYPKVQIAGVCTHFLQGEDLLRADADYTQAQLLAFAAVTKEFVDPSIHRHAYNSPATTAVLQKSDAFAYGCRPGLLTYGINPIPDLPANHNLCPVMEFRSKIVKTQRVKLGGVVSYGGTWRAQRDSLIGIVPAGYADGVCRSLSNRGEFLVSGARVPITGNVCMDYTMVDLTDLNQREEQLLGSDVVLIGRQGSEQITVEEVAKTANRITYEIVTGISGRVPRIYGDV